MSGNHVLFDLPLPVGWTVRNVDSIRSSEQHSCVAGPFGSSISSKYFVEEGVPVIRGSNLTDDLTRFVPSGFVFVSHEQAKKYKAQHVRADDLVFTCWGTVGQVGLIPLGSPYPEYIISNKQLKLRPNKDIADPKYLFYYFASPQMVAHIRGRAIGAAVPGINLGILKGLEVVLPPLPTQRRIASILSAYDDLIENNTRRIAILEEMARIIYEEWFVRFRFPGHAQVKMVESELGLIPEGWEITNLEAVSEYINRGLTPKYDDLADGIVINQKCIRGQKLSYELVRRQSKPIPADKRVRYGDVLVNSTGVGTLGRVAQVLDERQNCTVDTHVTIVRPGKKVTTHFYGLSLLAREEYFEQQGVGATGQTELGRGRVAETTFIVPPLVIQEQFDESVAPMRQMTVTLTSKNANLRATRDLLLPKLISGELDVSILPEPEEAISA